MPTAEVCRKHGVSTAAFYKYKAKFGCMECRTSTPNGGNSSQQFRGIATRYDRNPENYLAAIKLAATRIWIKAL